MKRIGKNALYQGITEKAFQAQIIQLAEALGYLVYHVPDSRRVTSAGFPDLVLARTKPPYRFLMCELKTERGHVRPEQHTWLNALKACGIECHVWRPHQIDDIMQILLESKRP